MGFCVRREVNLKRIGKTITTKWQGGYFSQEPYSSKLILANIPRIQFIQRLHWEKNVAGNFLCATKNCCQYIEDICIFRKDSNDYAGNHPLREYFNTELEKCGLKRDDVAKMIASGTASHYFTKGIQFECPTEINYKKLQSTGFFQKPYFEIKDIDIKYKGKYPSIFNLQGKKSKSNILKYSKDCDGYHPTQKPILLLEDLLLTDSNPDSLILDFTMGSGSTGVACIKTGRKFVGIEINENYFDIACKRIEEATRQGDMFREAV